MTTFRPMLCSAAAAGFRRCSAGRRSPLDRLPGYGLDAFGQGQDLIAGGGIGRGDAQPQEVARGIEGGMNPGVAAHLVPVIAGAVPMPWVSIGESGFQGELPPEVLDRPRENVTAVISNPGDEMATCARTALTARRE